MKYIKSLINLKKMMLIIGLVVILLIMYQGLGDVYFQQDEWHKIGKSMYYAYVNFGSIFQQKFGFHFVPLTSVYFVFEYLLYGLNTPLYLYTALLLHALASYMVYEITVRLFRNFRTAFVIAVLYAINPGIYQVILNEMVSIYSISFILVAILFAILHDSLQLRKPTWKQFAVVVALWVMSFSMLEVWYCTILLIPIFIFLFRSSKFRFVLTKELLSVCSVAVISVVVYSFFYLTTTSGSPIPHSAPMKSSAFYNAATVPIKFVVEYAVGLKNINALANVYQKNVSYYRADPTINQDLMAITNGYEIVLNYVFGIIATVAAIIIGVSTKSRESKRYYKILIFGVMWVVFVGAILSPQGRYFAALESRYLYLGGFGVLLILGALYSLLVSVFGKYAVGRKILFTVFVIYITAWVIYSYNSIRSEINQVITISRIRKQIISQIISLQPVLPKKALVYMYCSDGCIDNAKLGQLPEWIVPFQNGFGWNLLILYAQKEPKKYAPFFSDLYFWERLSTGYKEYNGIGFGYVTTKRSAEEIIEHYSIPLTDVVIFEYDSNRHSIRKGKYQ